MREIVPSQINVRNVAAPLVGTFGRTEREVAAAMLVLACQDHGAWYDVPPPDVGKAIERRADDPAFLWLRNPFCRPDFHELAAHGFAEMFDDPAGAMASEGEPMRLIRFTALGLERLARAHETAALRAEIERLRAEQAAIVQATKTYFAQVFRHVATNGGSEPHLTSEGAERAAKIVEELHGPDARDIKVLIGERRGG